MDLFVLFDIALVRFLKFCAAKLKESHKSNIEISLRGVFTAVDIYNAEISSGGLT